MKRLAFILILLALVWPGIAQAQGPIHLPVVVKMPVCDRTWRFIEPDGTSNEVLNPSFETTGSFVGGGGGVVTRTAAEGKYGLYGLRVQTAGNNQGVVISTATLANAAHYATLRVKGALPPNWYWSIDNGATFHAPRHIENIDNDWALYGFLFPASEANGSTTLTVYQNGAGSGDFYIDGVQVEAKTYWTTYCDGDQAGCEWDGGAHASSSTRSAQSRAGGRLRDFWEDYGFFVEESIGTGASPIAVSTRGYALLPGGELTGIKTEERQFTLVGKFIADSEEELHRNRQALLIALASASYPESQPVVIRYSGANEQKEISAHYEGGLEAQLRVSYGPYQVEGERWRRLVRWEERATIRFNAPDPLWREVGESAAVLDTNDSATFRIVSARLKATGQWDELGPPNAAGTYTDIWDIAINPANKEVYFGGSFINFDNVAAADYFAMWEPVTQAWGTLGNPLGNGRVRAIAVAANGDVYVGGDFSNWAGIAAADFIAMWDDSGSVWTNLNNGVTSAAPSVRAIAIHPNGNVFIGGDFTQVDGIAANRIAEWNPSTSTWSAVGAGLDGVVEALAISNDGIVYVGGRFANAGGNPAARIAQWDGSSWSQVGSSGMNNDVDALAIGVDGTLYAGGSFTTSDGVTTNRIAQWNGTTWAPLSSGVSGGDVSVLEFGPDNVLYVGGAFTSAGGIDLADSIARWNGATWAHLDINLPGSAVVRAIAASTQTDPAVSNNYDLFVGFNTTGTGNFAGLAIVENAGSYLAYPKVIFERSSGTTATIETVRNEIIGKLLLLDYDLLDGERLTIDLAPPGKSIISSFFGSRADAILPNSDFGSFALQVGDNDISSFVNVAGGPTITAYMLWRTPYDSLD